MSLAETRKEKAGLALASSANSGIGVTAFSTSGSTIFDPVTPGAGDGNFGPHAARTLLVLADLLPGDPPGVELPLGLVDSGPARRTRVRRTIPGRLQATDGLTSFAHILQIAGNG